MNKVITIPEHLLPKLEKKVAKLNKIASTFKIDPIHLAIEKNTIDSIGKGVSVRSLQIRLTGGLPKFKRWSLVGTLERIAGSDDIIVKSAEDIDPKLPDSFYHLKSIECEHCEVNRRRKTTFILRRDEEYKQVGTSCLKLFLGIDGTSESLIKFIETVFDPSKIINTDPSNISENDREEFYAVETLDLISRSVDYIKKHGFTSTKYSNSTAEVIKNSYEIEDTSSVIKYGALTIRTWILEKMENSSVEFESNVYKLVRSDLIAFKHFGFVVAAVNIYLTRKVNSDLLEDVNNESYGEIGDSVTFRGQILRKISYSTPTGREKNVLVIKSEDGYLFKTFIPACSFELYDFVAVTGKISNHETDTFPRSPFEGYEITILIAVKLTGL